MRRKQDAQTNLPAWMKILVWGLLLSLLAGVVYGVGKYFYQVRSTPFSMGWSEGNRLYDYSLMFAEGRYINPTSEPLYAFVSWGRQLIYGLIFLLPNVGIVGARLWQAVLWSFLPMLVGLAAVAGEKNWKNHPGWIAVFVLWTFLFLNQGPIYAPLLVSAIIVIFAVKVRSLPISLALVAAATWYANGSRWTWAYAPGIWAGMLALLQIDDPKFAFKDWKRLIRPVALGLVGLVTISVAQVFEPGSILAGIEYTTNNNPLEAANIFDRILRSVVAQDLIWRRLLPAPVYPPGILLGSLWAGLPALLLIGLSWIKHYWKINRFQQISVTVIMGAFWVVGLVVSTKIGGGSNLHNLDMLWITMVMLLPALLSGIIERWQVAFKTDWLLAVIMILAMLGPVLYTFRWPVGKLNLLNQAQEAAALDALQTEVDQVVAGGGQVLFIDQRQLLTFGEIQGVPMWDEYEKKVLMEHAMRGTGEYFDEFYKDLIAERFDLIVTDPINLYYKLGEDGFDAENNAWVHWISEPVTCYYEVLPQEDLAGVNIQLLVPRREPLSPELEVEYCPVPKPLP